MIEKNNVEILAQDIKPLETVVEAAAVEGVVNTLVGVTVVVLSEM